MGYHLEMKDSFSLRWSKVADTIIKDTMFKVTGLKAKEDYCFRVIAENKAGLGKPSLDLKLTAKYPFGKTGWNPVNLSGQLSSLVRWWSG